MSDDDEPVNNKALDSDMETKDNDVSSSSASSESGETFYDDGNDEEQDQPSEVVFNTLKLATVTCLHKYAIARMEGAENNSLPWPPLMLVVLTYLNRVYKRRELTTERNIAMLELTLKVPIQLRIKRTMSRGSRQVIDTIDLNDDASLDFSGMSFNEALEILRDLRKANVIKQEQIRTDALQALERTSV